LIAAYVKPQKVSNMKNFNSCPLVTSKTLNPNHEGN